MEARAYVHMHERHGVYVCVRVHEAIYVALLAKQL